MHLSADGQVSVKHSINRVVGLPSPAVPFQFDSLYVAFAQGYSLLYSGKPIPATPDNAVIYDSIPAPQAVVIDVSLLSCDLDSLLSSLFVVLLLRIFEKDSFRERDEGSYLCMGLRSCYVCIVSLRS